MSSTEERTADAASADCEFPLSALYAPVEPEYFAALDGVWKVADDPNAGFYAAVKNVNSETDPFRQECLRPRPAVEIGAWFKF